MGSICYVNSVNSLGLLYIFHQHSAVVLVVKSELSNQGL